jgi:putative transposase
MSSTPRSRNHVNRQSVNELAKLLGNDHEEILKKGIQRYFQEIFLDIAKALMAGEVKDLCGEMHERVPDRTFTRHGFQEGLINTLDGAKVNIERPRVRDVKTNREAKLNTYAELNDGALLDERALTLISAGVSEREFIKVLQKGMKKKKKGVSASTISRRVIQSAAAAMAEFDRRRWDKHRFVALFFDGVRMGQCLVVACVGVDLAGNKHVLAIQPGATESERVCRDLIRNLIEKGLDVDGNYLFIVDGSKGLRAAIREKFGKEAVFQRCQEHKIRDVQAYLPYKEREKIRSKMQAAYNCRTYDEASARLQEIRLSLAKFSEQAVRSITEGLEDSLTLHKLGIWGGLKSALRTTNIIESTFSIVRKRTRNVASWQDESQIRRWMVQGLMDAESRFRKVPGRRSLTRLRQKLAEKYKA